MTIQQKITINASSEEVYQSLTDGIKFGEITGAPSSIGLNEGDSFSVFGGQITGRHIELDANRTIVQAWRVGAWPSGVYSVVKFNLEENEGKTELILSQSSHPKEFAEHLEAGWHKMYWEPLINYFDK